MVTPLAYIVTGGQDAKIIVHDIDLDGKCMVILKLCVKSLFATEPVKVLTGHEKYISSVTYFAGLLISVSWDW